MASSTKPAWLSPTITGMSNFACQYNFQSIVSALVIMSATVCTMDDDNCRHGYQAEWVDSMSTAGVFLGAILGQMSMGFLGDYLNRSIALAITMAIAAFGAAMSALVSVQTKSPDAIYGTIIFFRFLLGIGAGGVYPLSATKASEDAAQKKGKVNSVSASWTYLWQFPGIVLPWFVAYLLTYSSSWDDNQRWRFLLGFGAVPFAIAIVLILIEIQWYGSGNTSKKDIEAPSSMEEQLIPSAKPLAFSDIWTLLATDPKTRIKLAVCGGCWFLYDVYTFGIGFLAGVIIEDISGDDDNVSKLSSVRNVTTKQMTALVIGIPAVVLCIYGLQYVGLKKLQIFGFTTMTITAIIFAVSFYPLQSHGKNQALFGIYCLCQVSTNFGVGLTAFTLPAALFPKRIRSTFNGLAAATGKLGAFIGAFSFRAITQTQGFAFLLGLCAVLSTVGGIVSWLLIDQSSILNEDEVVVNNDESGDTNGDSSYRGSSIQISNISNEIK
jgi:PHS family inorganic phosphate transporter-like MFS transporter